MSDLKKPLSLRARIARLDALIPEDADRLCCLEGYQAYREVLMPWVEELHAQLADPDPPSAPPVLPLGGVCRKSGAALCPLATGRATQVWERRRRLAVTFAGLSEADL